MSPNTLSLGSNAGKLASLRRLLDRLKLADEPEQFNGIAATAASASLTANDLPLTFAGPWAVFQMLNKAKVQRGSIPGTYDLSFALELPNTPVRAPDGTPIVVDYELSGRGAAMLAPGP